MIRSISPKLFYSHRLEEGYSPLHAIDPTPNSSPVLEASPVRQGHSSDNQVSTQQKKILMADDEPLIIKAMVRLLPRLLGLTHEDLITAANFESARLCFDQGASQIGGVITDMKMPCDGDGLRLYHYVRERNVRIPIAMVSGGMSNASYKLVERIQETDLYFRLYDKIGIYNDIADWIRANW